MKASNLINYLNAIDPNTEINICFGSSAYPITCLGTAQGKLCVCSGVWHSDPSMVTIQAISQFQRKE